MTIRTPKSGRKAGVVTLASSLLVLTSVIASAQDADETEALEEIIIQGARLNLQNAQDIKREADTFVDVISADDIGSLPDRSVLEAMQRIPGVSIERFAAANDPDHIGVEGSGAVVRGMTQTRSEFNGRDSFTANSGRGLSFQDVPPELMAGVDIYKNQTADMIEGGIAGTISLRTRKPFDQDGRRMSFSADVTYGDMAEEATPTVSALFSDRWDTSAGEFGFLINLSDSNLEAQSHGIQNDRMEFRPLTPPPVADSGVQRPGFPNVSTPYVYDGSFFFGGPNSGTAIEVDVGTPGVLVPNGANLTMKNDVRDRTGIAVATQWESPDDSLLASLQFMRSDATLAWTENAIKYQTGFNEQRTFGGSYVDAGGNRVWEDYQFDEDGVFTSGALTDAVDGWRGDGARVPHNASWGSPQVVNFGHRFQTDSRYKKTHTVVDDFAFNLQWSPTDNFELEFDTQYIQAETEDDDVTLMMMTWAIMHFDTSGSTPSADIVNPWFYNSEASEFATEDYFQQETSFLYNAAMDHYERSEGDSLAFRLDGTYHLDDGFITRIKAGVRSAERQQDVRFSAYNWNRLAPIWDSQIGWLDTEMVQGTPLADYDVVDWSNFHRGGVVAIQGGNHVIHPADSLTRDYANWGSHFEPFYNPSDNDSCGAEWRPASQRVQAEWNADTQSCVPENTTGFFLDNEVFRTTETNQAAYVRVDFGADLGNVRASGNFGLRYVRITNETEGFTTYPSYQRSERLPVGWDPQNVNPGDFNLWDHGNDFLGSAVNFVNDDILGFANNAYVANTAERTYDDVLPSLNLKLDLNDELIARFALSKAIALPDIGDMRNYINIGARGGTLPIREPYWGEANPHPDTPVDPDTGLPHELGLPASVVDAGGAPIFDTLTDIHGQERMVPVTDLSRGQPLYMQVVEDDEIVYVPVVLDGEEVDYTIEQIDGLNVLTAGNARNQQRVVDPNGAIFNGWTGSSGNPLLMPMESIQFDASLEWYFSDVGSLTASFFYKDLKNFFVNGAYEREFTNPVSGVTQSVFVSGPQNGGDGTMQGIELAYQQFFDMLPEPFDGLGVQANYSYIEARGVPNANLDPTNPDLESADFTFGDDLPLQGQSDHTANLVLMYEKYDWSLRLAYNWRSKYLLTSRDVITGLPVYNDDLGFLDGSIFYNVTDNIQVGFQGVNLLDTQTKTLMQVDDTLQVGRSWFVNDRRYTFLVRASF